MQNLIQQYLALPDYAQVAIGVALYIFGGWLNHAYFTLTGHFRRVSVNDPDDIVDMAHSLSVLFWPLYFVVYHVVFVVWYGVVFFIWTQEPVDQFSNWISTLPAKWRLWRAKRRERKDVTEASSYNLCGRCCMPVRHEYVACPYCGLRK